MEPRPIRMPDELWEAIEEDAARNDRAAAEHVRYICREYLKGDTRNVRDRLDDLEARLERVEEVEDRVDRLESLEQRVHELEEALSSEGEAESPGATAEPRASERRTSTQTAETETPATAEPAETSPASTAGAESESGGGPPTDVEPIESVDDVLAKARQRSRYRGEDEQSKRRRAAARAALEALREKDDLSEQELREELAREYAVPGEDDHEWWHETVFPVLEIAEEWGLVVALPGDEYKWVGASVTESGRTRR